MFLLMHKCQSALNSVLRTSGGIVVFEEWYRGSFCQIFKVLALCIFDKRIPEKIWRVVFIYSI
jgi:hypothetical protein